MGFLCLLLPFTLMCSAQFHEEELDDVYGRHELSFVLGASNFLGDIGGNPGIGKAFIKDFTFKTVRPLAGLAWGYYPENWYKITAGINYTRVTAADSLIRNGGGMERWRYYRNLSFRSDIFEAYAGVEVYPLTLKQREHVMQRINPFIGLGVGLFHFNPQTNLKGRWIDLKTLHLEGQNMPEYPDRKEYSLTQFYIPFSLGIKYYLNNRLSLSIGATFRKTFTDYIDDISTTYVNPAIFDKNLSADNAILARQLYSRSITPWKVKPGIEKADNRDKDSYISMYISLHITFDKYFKFYYGGM